MTTTTPEEPWALPELTRARRAIVVVDVVESVRLMQEDEAGFIERWRRFVHEVRTSVLPQHGGRMVKSLGDGMLLEFRSVRQAFAVASNLQRVALDQSLTAGTQSVLLRIGLHQCDVVSDSIDVYGHGVNLTARLAALGSPGEIVLSVEARDEITAGLDARIEDMGMCYLKHIPEPVRAFRATGVPVVAALARPDASLVPVVAVVPPAPEMGNSSIVCSVVLDDIAAAMARFTGWRVVSPLTMNAFAGREIGVPALSSHVKADYVVFGSVPQESARSLLIHIHSGSDGMKIWEGEFVSSPSQLLQGEDRLAMRVAHQIASVLVQSVLSRASGPALHNVPGYALLLQSIAAIHRLSDRHSAQALAALEHLVDRHPRAPDARTWLAKHYFMRLPQGHSLDRMADVGKAKGALAKALDLAPEHGLANALLAHLDVYVERKPDKAILALDKTTEHSPNEPLAWLFKANAFTALDQPSAAVRCIGEAYRLSPLDPLSYFFDTLAAAAYRGAGRYEEALAFAQRSVQANAIHLPGRVELILAQMACGQEDRARASALQYLSMRPSASVRRYLDNHPGGERPFVQSEARALIEAGIPM